MNKLEFNDFIGNPCKTCGKEITVVHRNSFKSKRLLSRKAKYLIKHDRHID